MQKHNQPTTNDIEEEEEEEEEEVGIEKKTGICIALAEGRRIKKDIAGLAYHPFSQKKEKTKNMMHFPSFEIFLLYVHARRKCRRYCFRATLYNDTRYHLQMSNDRANLKSPK